MASAVSMEVADFAVVAIYFILVLMIGFLAMRRANRNTVKGYFLANHTINQSINQFFFIYNIGSEHFIGLAGSGAAIGLSVAAWELNAVLLLQLLGWIFIPVYIHSGVYTMPEFLDRRYGGRRLQLYFAILSLLVYILTKLSVALYAGALFIQESLGWNLYLSIILLIAMTGLLTVTGGLVAVIYTDTVQAVIMVVGALCLAAISFFKVGGLEGVKAKYMEATPNITSILLSSPNLTLSESCHDHLHPNPNALKILGGPADPNMPWPGFLLGQIPCSIWYLCTDQVIVQRVLAAKNIVHTKTSTIMAGSLKILPMFVIIIPVMISRIFFADELVCINPEHCMEVCGSPAGCSNLAYPRLVMHVMPVGLHGMMMAVMMAAIMSELDSIFNSASTIFTLDIYKMLRKQASSRELVIAGRLFVFLMVVVSIAWVPVVITMQKGQMFYYIQEVTDYLTPPIAALFLLGILWCHCNETGTFWGGMVGLTLGLLRLSLFFFYKEPHCDQPDERPSFIKDVHFMYVATILFCLSALLTIVVSLCTSPPQRDQIRTTTLWGLKQRKKLKEQGKGKDGEEMKTLTPLTLAVGDGNDQSKKVEGTEQSPHQNNASVMNNTETQLPIQNCCHSLNSDPKIEDKGKIWGEDGGEDVEECSGAVVGGDKCMVVLQYVCGVQQKPSKTQALPVKEYERVVDDILHESLRTRILLNVGLVLICSAGVFLLIYFSL
ncbi:sodium/myo-inositol cotransporter-like [Thalassophryne amazonica]|uniref:sodium/myo-inositol cotransporter-like n=1 Tax=Thalassophryne amazonica TaxID=390379 RepID=UPI001470A81C|nr:sodium/myo-inositol cotransporter-like [Thalassophryne amazonica]